MKKLRTKRVHVKKKPGYVDDPDEKIKDSRKALSIYTGDNRKKKNSIKSRLLLNDQDSDYTCKSNLLLNHCRTRKDERPFPCKFCKQRFETNSLLIHHKRKHSKVKRFCCNDCNSRFRSGGELLRHIRYMHTHEKPFKCTKCDYAFVERSKLARHMLSHTADRQECPHCPFTSSNAVKFRQHENIHKDENHKSQHKKNVSVKCVECGLSFSQKKILEHHLAICDGKYGHKRKLSELKKDCYDSTEEVQDSDNKLVSSQLLVIGEYLIKGEAILIPETGGDKYVMIKVIPDDEEAIKACDIEFERNEKSDVDSDCESNGELTDTEDEELIPFFGFDWTE